MNGNKVLVDTNILLYLLGGDEDLATLLEGRHVYISFITELELFSSQDMSADERKKVEGALE